MTNKNKINKIKTKYTNLYSVQGYVFYSFPHCVSDDVVGGSHGVQCVDVVD